MLEYLKNIWGNSRETDKLDEVLMFISRADRDISLEVLKDNIKYLAYKSINSYGSMPFYKMKDKDEVKIPNKLEVKIPNKLKENLDKKLEVFTETLYKTPSLFLSIINDKYSGERSDIYLDLNKYTDNHRSRELTVMRENFEAIVVLVTLFGLNKSYFYSSSCDTTEKFIRSFMELAIFNSNTKDVITFFNYIEEYMSKEMYLEIVKDAKYERKLNYILEERKYKDMVLKELIAGIDSKFEVDVKSTKVYKQFRSFILYISMICSRYIMIDKYNDYVVGYDDIEVKDMYRAPILPISNIYIAKLNNVLFDMVKNGICAGFVNYETKIDRRKFSIENYARNTIKEVDEYNFKANVRYRMIRDLIKYRKGLIESKGNIPEELDFLREGKPLDEFIEVVNRFLNIVSIMPKMFMYALETSLTSEIYLTSLVYKFYHNYLVKELKIEDGVSIFVGKDIKLIEGLMDMESLYKEDELLRCAVANINDLFEESPPTQLVRFNINKVFYDKYFEYKEGILYGTNRHFNESKTRKEAVLRLTIMDSAAQVMAYKNTLEIHKDDSEFIDKMIVKDLYLNPYLESIYSDYRSFLIKDKSNY